MRILVTGATGFMGAHLCRALVEKGEEVRIVRRENSSQRQIADLPLEHFVADITDFDSLLPAFEGVDVVFHLAALTTDDQRQMGRMYEVNVGGTHNVLEAAKKAGVERVVHTSSAAALGVPESPAVRNAAPVLIDENHTWNYRADYWYFGYAKYLAEREVQRFVSQGLDVVTINPTHVVGRGDLYRQTSSMIVQVAQKRVPTMINGGLNVVHVDDVIDGFFAALAHGKSGHRYLMCGENMTYEQYFDLISEVIGVDSPSLIMPSGLVKKMVLPLILMRPFIHLPVAPALLRLAGKYFYYDSRKARADLRLATRRKVDDAVKEAYAWFQVVGALPLS